MIVFVLQAYSESAICFQGVFGTVDILIFKNDMFSTFYVFVNSRNRKTAFFVNDFTIFLFKNGIDNDTWIEVRKFPFCVAIFIKHLFAFKINIHNEKAN